MLDLQRLLRLFVHEIPFDVIWIVGIVLALRSWQRHPQVSLLVLIAFGLELAQSVGGTLARHWLDSQLQDLHLQGADRTAREPFIVTFTILGYVRWGLDILAWILILVALFRWRNLPNRRLGHDGQYLPEGFLSMES